MTVNKGNNRNLFLFNKNYLELQLYKLKKYFFKHDKHIFVSSLILFLGGIFSYYSFVFLGKWIPFLPAAWDFSIFLPFWISFISLLLTILVSLKLSLKKTEDAKDFIEILSGEINRAVANEQFNIIIPNLNVAQYNFPDEFFKLKDVITKATKRGVKIRFITLGLKKEYIDKYNNCNDMPSKSTFFMVGNQNDSPVLSYIFTRYSQTLDTVQYDDTIAFFNELFSNDNITFVHCKKELDDTKILGFSSNKIAFIGKYYDITARTGRVMVEGEIIDTEEAVGIINDFLIKRIISEYEIETTTY